MNELCNPTADFQPISRELIQRNKKAKEMLMQCTECQYCHNYFLNTWRECVKFIHTQGTFKENKADGNRITTIIPQRVLLSSYEYFNSSGHNYFGVAFT